MKKCCIIFLLSIIISLTAFGVVGGLGSENSAPNETEYLRIHIRADSNEHEAQAVKYLVKEEVVDYLTPLVAQYESMEEAYYGVADNLIKIEERASEVLKRNGFSYGAKASVRRENFPTRVYEGYTLPAGEYTALIIELGSGKGDNWWCVVYPPLCFTATKGENVVYKSKIVEIIKAWRAKREG
ncbi:MAG: hypothetical protein E7368_03225 [Clostridiales bacterium]|nr:hypothetical protein [Clostridiales bacterium]